MPIMVSLSPKFCGSAFKRSHGRLIGFACALLLFAIVPTIASAQPAPLVPLTLDEAIARAQEQNPTLLAAGYATEAASHRIREQRMGYLPVITFVSSVARANQPPKYPVPGPDGEIHIIDVGSANSMQLRLQVDQTVYDFGKTRHTVQAAELERDAMGAAYDQTAADIVEQIKEQFYRARFFSRLDSLYGETIEVGQQLEKISQAQVRNGAVLPVEVLRAQVDLQNYRSQRAVARSEAAKSLDQLALLLGQGQHDFVPAGDLPVLPEGIDPDGLYDGLYQQALQSRHDLRQLDLRQRQQAELMAAIDAQGKPSVNLQFSGAYLGPKSLFGIDAPGISPFNIRLGVGLTFNVLGPYAARVKGQELQATQDQLQEQERASRLELGAQIKSLLNDLESQQATLESSRALLDQAQANLNLADATYKQGAVSLLDYTQAQVTATAARAAYEQARFNIAQVLLGLERTVGAQINFSTR